MATRTPTGRYRDVASVLPRVLAAQGANGEQAESWPDPPAGGERLYPAARDALTGGELIVQGLRQSTGALKLRIKGRAIPVAASDRVKLVATGELFNVTGVAREHADTVLLVERAAQQTTGQ